MDAVDLKREKLKQRLTYAAIALSYAPFLIFANLPSSGNVDSIITYVSSQTGYLAAIMFLWQFILGTRAISALVHKDQVWALNLHKKFGMYGIALVVAHPVLIAYRYSEDFLYLFWGPLETEFDQHVAMGRFAFLIFLLVWVTSAVLRARIGYRPWRYIHWLSYAIMPLVLLHAPKVGSFYAGDDMIRALWNVVIVVFTLVVALRLRYFFTYGQYPYRLVAKKEAAQDVFMYRLVPLSKKIMPHPGQFVYVRRSFFSEEHPFSVAGIGRENGEITVAAKVFGKYTKKLSELPVGSILSLDGPYGVFAQEVKVDPETPTSFIAGGIGITPFVQHILDSEGQRITLFNANRAPDNVVLGSLLKKKLGKRYVDVFSDVDQPGAEKGRVDADLIKKHLKDEFDTQQFYICGPPPMMAGVKRSLIDAGVDPKRIHTEEFGF